MRLCGASLRCSTSQKPICGIFDYDGVKRVLADHETFSSSMFTANRRNPEWFIFFDSPRHTQLRALITRAFTPRVVANLEPASAAYAASVRADLAR